MEEDNFFVDTKLVPLMPHVRFGHFNMVKECFIN
jgi:hypothetical protein